MALVALLAWGVAEPPAPREHLRGAHGVLPTDSHPALASAGDEIGLRVNRAPGCGPAALVRARPDAPAWRADADHHGPLDALRAEQLARPTRAARAWLRLYPARLLPSGEPSPYDATAPPSAVQRDV
jgi:hypothetical protein